MGRGVILIGAGVLGCGDSGGRGEGDGGASASAPTSASASADDAATGSASADDEGTASADGTAAATGSTADSVDSGADDNPVKFDIAGVPDNPGETCGGGKGGGGGLDFSYIWIADSTQNAVSKINTQTLIEEGRYLVHPGSGNPSRTSVSLSGDVAIANRNGGVTKVYANQDDCVDINGMAGIQTSSGGNDVLPWGQDDCVAWHTAMAYSTQRPVAWSPGDFDNGTCEWENEKVWTTGAQSGQSGTVVTTVLNGDTGDVEQEIPMPDIAIGGFGPYGAAFDPNGDYWFVDSGNDGPVQELVRVDHVTYDYSVWMTPSISPYGFTVDTMGRPWIAGFAGGVSRFDPVTETFDTNAELTGLGIQEDADGIMWMAHYPWTWEGLYAIDRDTMDLVQMIALPSQLGKGVSIDFYGYVWLVDQGTSAFRVDPASGTFDQFMGLTGPYTYSDMTGWGLKNVTNPEG
jgi:hypothetical protein